MNSEQRWFKGFSKDTVAFLKDISVHNSKAWFEQNRQRYENVLLEPFRDLVGDLAELMEFIDPDIEIRPQVNKTISRIFRDTRFSNDKSLLRDHMWLTFKRPGNGWQGLPAFFFELSPKIYRWGMGYYMASSRTMAAFRESLSDDPDTFLESVRFLQDPLNELQVCGEMYKRPYGADLPAELDLWYNRKNLYLMATRRQDDLIYSPELAELLSVDFQRMQSLYHFLMKVGN